MEELKLIFVKCCIGLTYNRMGDVEDKKHLFEKGMWEE